jgi:hypothetical protein
MPTRRPRAPLNGLPLDAWIIFDISVQPVVMGLHRFALLFLGCYLMTVVFEGDPTGFAAALSIMGAACAVAAYVLTHLHVTIGRRIHFRVPQR